MIKKQTIWWKMPLLVILCALAGWILLCVVYFIPTDRMNAHAKDSAYLFETEYKAADGYKEVTGDRSSTPDYMTDALMLLTASYDSPHPSWKAALLAELEGVDGYDAHRSIVMLASDEADVLSKNVLEYDRFWHGYLVFLKPLFFLAGYGKIRYLQIWVHLGLFLLTELKLYRVKKQLCLPWFVTWAFLHPPVIMLCTTYSLMTLCAPALMLVMLHIRSKEEPEAPVNMDFWCLFFVFAGCATIYLDFLTMPVLTLGLPLVLWIALCSTDSLPADVMRTIGLSASWGFGYAGMWFVKWVLVSLFTEKNIFEEVINQVRIRSDVTGFSYGEVLRDNLFSSGINQYLLPVFAVVLVAGIVLSVNHIRSVVPYLIVACYPFIWYAVLQEHSYYHSHFTYRLLSVAVFAVLVIGANAFHGYRMRKRGL